MATQLKRIRKSKYKYVSLYYDKNENERWGIHIIKGQTTYFNTEKEATIAVDLYLIKNNKEPMNVLKSKK